MHNTRAMKTIMAGKNVCMDYYIRRLGQFTIEIQENILEFEVKYSQIVDGEWRIEKYLK